jgi:hypothetical protein
MPSATVAVFTLPSIPLDFAGLEICMSESIGLNDYLYVGVRRDIYMLPSGQTMEIAWRKHF